MRNGTDTLGDVLRGWREARHLTLDDAAAMIGTSRATLSRIERGLPSHSGTIKKILCWLFGEKGQ